MPRVLYAWRFRREIPLLSDEEFKPIEDLLRNRISLIKEHRQKMKVSLAEANEYDAGGRLALQKYEDICGVRLDYANDLYAVKLSNYGRPCPECGKPFRTPRARYCAGCGYTLPEGQVAGPASL